MSVSSNPRVLLLMVQAQLNKCGNVRHQLSAQQLKHRSIHMGAVSQHLGHRGPAQVTTLVPWRMAASTFVVAVEEICVARMEDAVGWLIPLEDQGFKKPTGVRKMPFGRADLCDRLRYMVLRCQGRTNALGPAPHVPVSLTQNVFR